MPVTHVSRVYANINTSMGPNHWDYDNIRVNWGDMQNFVLEGEVGSGHFGQVFTCRKNLTRRKLVVKILMDRSDNVHKRAKREIKILQLLSGGPSIVTMVMPVAGVMASGEIPLGIVMEIAGSMTLIEKLNQVDLDNEDIKEYMYQLLQALDYSHRRGIMHRDVKPNNIMVRRSSRRLKLVDWGMAEFYFPGKEYTWHVDSKHYKAPELLMHFTMYDYGLDIWAVGCILAGLIFKKVPFFNGRNSSDQLYRITKVLGSQVIMDVMETYQVSEEYRMVMSRKKDWFEFRNIDNMDLVGEKVVDLMDRMLVPDMKERISAAEALEHQYFDFGGGY